jgi:hypothetical protein
MRGLSPSRHSFALVSSRNKNNASFSFFTRLAQILRHKFITSPFRQHKHIRICSLAGLHACMCVLRAAEIEAENIAGVCSEEKSEERCRQAMKTNHSAASHLAPHPISQRVRFIIRQQPFALLGSTSYIFKGLRARRIGGRKGASMCDVAWDLTLRQKNSMFFLYGC